MYPILFFLHVVVIITNAREDGNVNSKEIRIKFSGKCKSQKSFVIGKQGRMVSAFRVFMVGKNGDCIFMPSSLSTKLTFVGKWQPRDEKVKIQLLYECLCPSCRQFDTTTFKQVYEKLQNYLDVKTYPYGNAQTIIHDDGTFEIKCQHGEAECYGNMLHACAIDYFSSLTTAMEFNACLMDTSNAQGSDDVTADQCSQQLGVDASPIKECAKGQKGKDLLKYYGDESHKIHYEYVPWVLINGQKWDSDTDGDFMRRVCREFVHPPAPCNE